MFSPDSNYIINQLIEEGFALLTRPDNECELLSIASKYGKIVPDNNGNIIQKLRVRQKGAGIRNSFSYCFGQEKFPWHTDTAFWNIPVRYIMLSSQRPSTCTTNCVRIDKLFDDKEYFKFLSLRAIFLVRLPSSIRVLPFLFKNANSYGYRYDQHIMTPYNKEAKELDQYIKEKLRKNNYSSIHWNGQCLALIDNWKVVHNRSKCINDPERELLRIYIGE